MIIRQFLAWTQHTSAGRRAEAASALARAYLFGSLGPDAAWEAKTAILALLDDPAPLVRQALADACATSARAPRPLVVALATDLPDIACTVLATSPILTDADLVDAAAMGAEAVRTTIAGRPNLPHAVSGALAEIGESATLTVLARNRSAQITAGRLLRMVERCGTDAALREALLDRPNLPPEVRHALARALAGSLARYVTSRGWLGPERSERMSREASERAVLDLCRDAGPGTLTRVVQHLRATGQLNAGLMLRAVLSGEMGFARTAFADLSGMEPAKAASILEDGRGFAELHERAGLPESLMPAFAAALIARREALRGGGDVAGAGLSRRMIERALSACETLPFAEMQSVTALLSRYEAEAARDEARTLARQAADEAIHQADTREAAERLDAEWTLAQAAESERMLAGEPTVLLAAPGASLQASFGTAAFYPALEQCVAQALDVADAFPGTGAAPEPVFAPDEIRVASEARLPAATYLPAVAAALDVPAHAGLSAPRVDAAVFDAFAAVLDGLPDAMLESFQAERAAQARKPGDLWREKAVDVVLDTLPDALIAQYRSERERISLAA